MRTKISNKKRDGFAGELLISIPQNVLAGAIQKGQILPHQLYVSHIGYFPKVRKGVSTISCSTVSREKGIIPSTATRLL